MPDLVIVFPTGVQGTHSSQASFLGAVTCHLVTQSGIAPSPWQRREMEECPGYMRPKPSLHSESWRERTSPRPKQWGAVLASWWSVNTLNLHCEPLDTWWYCFHSTPGWIDVTTATTAHVNWTVFSWQSEFPGEKVHKENMLVICYI